ncbi:HTTM domain-containing protein [Dyadobacter sp. CY261]|uniref:HTTM domain-containing protein n=1 Tax=Dyadobacter sp. CY261 TaxID=2907203 RepID=UPI001F15879B|nr:HTTM domain-containing protein [Dyadobacter sp. CY261]MCF0071005.1 HTTM domain-containing protein [Dyadobacter sp. CY261]
MQLHLNPFYIKEKPVVPELVLAIRLLASYLLLTREFPFNGNQGTGRFFPLVDFLSYIGTDDQFDLGVRIVFLAGIAVILFSRCIRLGASLVGLSFVTGLLSCQICISVAHLFTACVFLCTALSNLVTGTDLIRFQLVVLYLGADLNKIFDIDWWTGASIETLLVSRHHIAPYMAAADIFPPLFLSQITGIGVIVLQMGIAILLINRKTIPYAMFLALGLHLPMVVLMQITFGPFLFALVVAYGSLLTWPRQLICNARLHSPMLVKWLKKLDFNEQVVPCSEPAGESFARWLRTGLGFISHPVMLLSATLLAVALIRYGKFILLSMVVILAVSIYAWPQHGRSRAKPSSGS